MIARKVGLIILHVVHHAGCEWFGLSMSRAERAALVYDNSEIGDNHTVSGNEK